MFINSNLAASNANRHLFNTNLSVDRAMERLTSGLRINSAADDASGLAIARKMESQNRGLEVANQNGQDGLALYKIAEGALEQVNQMLTRMQELSTRAINGTLTDTDRATVQNEINQLLDQINQVSKTTEYNTIKLLDGTLKPDVATNITTGVADSIRFNKIKSETQSGSFAFSLLAVASAATMTSAAPAAAVMPSSGVITINGIDLPITAGDSVSIVAAKINAINSQTGVAASFDPATSALTLVTATLDEDAKNIIDPTTGLPAPADTIGYATVGSQAVIRLSGNTTVIGNLGLTAGSTFGTNSQGNIDGVTMWSYGNKLRAVNQGARSYGIELDVDLFNGNNGAFIRSAVPFANIVTHQSNFDGITLDEATVDINTDNRMRLQIGANYNQSIYDGITDVTSNRIGVGGSTKIRDLSAVDVTNVDNANLSLKVIQKAIIDISSSRSEIGAIMNRLDYTVKTVQIQRENMMAAQSRIEDADMAQEMTNFTKSQIMIQAGTAMLAQANARPQQVLQLLKG